MITRCLPAYAVLQRPIRPQHAGSCWLPNSCREETRPSLPAPISDAVLVWLHVRRPACRLLMRNTAPLTLARSHMPAAHASRAEAPGWGAGRWLTRRCSARPRWSARSARRHARARTCSGWPTACALPCFHHQARMLVTLPGGQRQTCCFFRFWQPLLQAFLSFSSHTSSCKCLDVCWKY